MTPKTPPRSKDDADVTLDLSLPRSASGRYWKDQYDSYSARSESEVKRFIIKQRVAKDYARIKGRRGPCGPKGPARLGAAEGGRSGRIEARAAKSKTCGNDYERLWRRTPRCQPRSHLFGRSWPDPSTVPEKAEVLAGQPDSLTKLPTAVPARSLWRRQSVKETAELWHRDRSDLIWRTFGWMTMPTMKTTKRAQDSPRRPRSSN